MDRFIIHHLFASDLWLLILGLVFLTIPSTVYLWRAWYRRHPYYWIRDPAKRAELLKKEQIFYRLFEKSNAFQRSYDERQQSDLSESYVYGEIIFSSFALLLDIAKPQEKDIFYDLGCGAGKALCATALCTPIQQIKGVEGLSSLVELAQEHNASFPQVSVIKADLLEYDFSEATLLFINATCFYGKLWETILARLLTLRRGARIILSTRLLPSEHFECLYQKREVMSWGLARVSVYKKK